MRRTTLRSFAASSAATPSASMTSYGGEVSVARSPATAGSKRRPRNGDSTRPAGDGTSEGRLGEEEEECGLRPEDAGFEPAVMAGTLGVPVTAGRGEPIEYDEEEC